MKGFYESNMIKQDSSKTSNLPDKVIVEKIQPSAVLPQSYDDSPAGVRKQHNEDVKKSK